MKERKKKRVKFRYFSSLWGKGLQQPPLVRCFTKKKKKKKKKPLVIRGVILLQHCLRACLHGNILRSCGCSDTIELNGPRCRISNTSEGKYITNKTK